MIDTPNRIEFRDDVKTQEPERWANRWRWRFNAPFEHCSVNGLPIPSGYEKLDEDTFPSKAEAEAVGRSEEERVRQQIAQRVPESGLKIEYLGAERVT